MSVRRMGASRHAERMEIVAHRGASFDAPENTLAAARLAWAQGADAIECDVRRTADGRVAVAHDADLRRVGGRAVEVAASTWAALRAVDVGASKGAEFVGERVPELREWLALVPAGKRALVEIKDGESSVEPVLREVAAAGFSTKQLVVISFELAVVAATKRRLPTAQAWWIVEAPGEERRTWAKIVDLARAARVDGLDVAHAWSEAAVCVSTARAAGLRLGVWTIDDEAEARRWGEAGADAITTNRPGWLRERLA